MDALTLVAENVYQLQLPLPFALRSVNIYLLRGEQGWTIIDTGINTQQAQQRWHEALTALHITPANIQQIILTHAHPDHFGLAGWLQSLAAQAGRDVPVYLSRREQRMAQEVWYENRYENFGDWMQLNGMPATMAQDVRDSQQKTRDMTFPHPPDLQDMPATKHFSIAGRDWQVLHAPGHADGHIILYDAQDHLLLSGDHVLMKITPNIGLWQDSDPHPLEQFMASLHGMRSLDVRLALPGHKWLITDWVGRIDELLAHHEERLQACLRALDSGARSAYEVAGAIFTTERFTVHEWRFAIAETLAHLDLLDTRQQAALHQNDHLRWYTLR